MYGCSDYDASFDYEATTGNLTQHTVSGLEPGLKYVWKVGYKDSSGNISWSREYTFKLGASEADSILRIYPGAEVTDYKMASFVHWPDNPAATSVFGADYASDDFRIGTYDPAGEAYVEYGSTLKIEPGRAYWFLARNGLDITVEGVPVSLSHDIEVRLLYNSSSGKGWNMIACPNNTNYYWGHAQVLEYDANGNVVYGPTAIADLPDPNDYVDKQLWSWDNGSYRDDADLMEKHEGYWVKAKKANVFLRFPVRVQAGLSNPATMIAKLLNKGKRWINRRLAPNVAIADSEDSPPAPMGDFGTKGGDSSGGPACFITSAAHGSLMEP